MKRLVVVFIIVIGSLLQGTTILCAIQDERENVPADTFAFTRFGKSALLGAVGILRSDSSMILVTSQDIVRSSDNGATWKSLAEPLQHYNITSVIALSDTIYAGSGHGIVYRSVNHGLDWRIHQRVNFKPIRGFTTSGEPSPEANQTMQAWPRPSLHVQRTDSSVSQSHVVGVTRSVTWYELQNARATLVTDSLVVIATRNDTLYLLNLVNGTTTALRSQMLSGKQLSNMAIRGDTLYLGTKLNDGGVYRVVLSTDTWEQMIVDRVEGSLDVHSLSINERGVYIATREHGVLTLVHGTTIIRTLSDGIRNGLNQSVSRLGGSWVVSSLLKGAYMFDDDGKNIRLISTTAPISSTYVVSVLDSLLVMGLADGSMYVSRDTGRTWTFQSKPFEQSELVSLVSINTALYACTTNGLLMSRDSARAFTHVVESLRGENVQDLLHTDSLKFVVASSGMYTIDNHGRLNMFTADVTVDNKIRLSDVRNCGGVLLAAGYPGLFYSRNHGLTWQLVTIPKVIALRTLSCDRGSIYVAADNGDIYVSPIPQWIRKRTTPR